MCSDDPPLRGEALAAAREAASISVLIRIDIELEGVPNTPPKQTRDR